MGGTSFRPTFRGEEWLTIHPWGECDRFSEFWVRLIVSGWSEDFDSFCPGEEMGLF